MSKRVQKVTEDLGDLTELVFKSIIAIVFVVFTAKVLLPFILDKTVSEVSSYIIGLVLLFCIIVSKRVRREILVFGK